MVYRAAVSISNDTLNLSGILDYESVLDVDMQGRDWIKNAAPSECNLNLSAVTYSNSAGIALLLGWLRAAQEQRKVLHILKLPENMAALAKVGGLEDILM